MADGADEKQHGPPLIDWQSASVASGELRVELAGKPPKGFKARFAEVVRRLRAAGSDPWGEVVLAHGEIRVQEVPEGCEDDLRHVLESVVQQVGADLAPPPEHDGEKSAQERRDEQMTEAFRSFAAGS